MNILVISNMRPSKAHPTYGIFVQNQVDALRQCSEVKNLQFVAIESRQKGLKGLLKKYSQLIFNMLTQAVFSSRRYDIIHVHYFYPTIWFALLYKLLRNPKAKIVVTFHGSDIYLNEPPSALYRFCNRFINHAIFVSKGLKNRYYRKDLNTSTISAGILDCFAPRQSDKIYDFIMVGAVDYNKGLDRLLEILSQTERGLRIAIIGEGSFVEKILAYRSDVHTINYLGSQSPKQVTEYLNQSRYLLSLSRNESFGLVMTEAMACGVPVIASTTDGAREQMIEGHNGFLLDNDSEEFTKQAMDTMTLALDKSADEHKTLADNGRAGVQQHRLSQVITSLVGVYRHLANNK